MDNTHRHVDRDDYLARLDLEMEEAWEQAIEADAEAPNALVDAASHLEGAPHTHELATDTLPVDAGDAVAAVEALIHPDDREDPLALDVAAALDDGGPTRPADALLAVAIRRALRHDPLTAALDVRVRVRRRVAYLTGEVLDLDDALNAEAVAGRVPGIVAVEEQLETEAG